jgi:hypothetical protein
MKQLEPDQSPFHPLHKCIPQDPFLSLSQEVNLNETSEVIQPYILLNQQNPQTLTPFWLALIQSSKSWPSILKITSNTLSKFLGWSASASQTIRQLSKKRYARIDHCKPREKLFASLNQVGSGSSQTEGLASISFKLFSNLEFSALVTILSSK